ncbi:PT domain-containing protein [Streptomyces justiciae]|uniref:PT domain-containing protein n=1 Tax=Streptomyces justiciae TaxID=2780140 RepID=UPI002118398D|nr:PT domain-containing protein [Streptomyces justiciae]MCW8382350.1 PT domain-containing protein [Streptomyces justiciae]
MNTERPDNDDDAEVVDRDTGADEAAEEATEAAPEETGETAEAVAEETGETRETDAEETGGATEEAAEESGAPEEPVVAATGERDDTEHPARRRSPVLIASVAAAVLLVGGGGAYLATGAASGSGDGGTTSGAPGDDTPPPLHLDGYGEGGGTGGIAPGEPNPYGVTYQADGTLPDGPDSAPVYRATGEVTKDEVARLAEALGVAGTPVLEGKAWKVGGQDAAGPSLQVNQLAPGTWTFHRYAPGTDDCKSETVCASDPAAPAGDPVGEDVAKKAAAPVLKAVGQDDAKVDASQVMGAQRVVNADPVVGGLPTHGWTTGVTVNAQGEVVGGSGQLKAPVKGDTYPVVGAEKALELMNARSAGDHRMGIGGCASPVPLKDRLEAPCGSSSGTPEAGTPVPPKQDTITVEKAVFGLAAQYVDARQTLVPSWLFQVKAAGAQDSFTVTYPAVDPKYIASATPSAEPSGEPTAPPSPRPTGPGSDEPTAAPATRDVQVDGYTADGNELTVSFTGGVCADYKAAAVEGSDKVTVTVTETPWPDKVCIMIAKVYHQSVPLDEPLGDRKVVGSDGKEIPLEKAGARLPGTSGAR